MQTFLPYANFELSFKVLDPKRIGNQVWREGVTLLRGKWPNHPASKMWRPYQDALAAYLHAGVLELRSRGYDHYDKPWAEEIRSFNITSPIMPCWLGDEKFHASHRSNLLRKDFEWYSQFGWEEPTDLPYVWPNV